MEASFPPLGTSVLLVAAGSSSRMGAPGGGVRKPFLEIGGRTVLEHACAAFDAVGEVEEIVLVGHAEDLGRLGEMAGAASSFRKVRAIVAGGEKRIDSVRAGAAAASGSSAVLCVHDAARPLIEPETIRRAIETAARKGAALVAVPVRDTIKTSADGTHAEGTLDRSVLWAAQTPQAFQTPRLLEILKRAEQESLHPTDEAALYERFFAPIPIVEGSPANLKITTPADLAIATALFELRSRERR